MEGTRHEKASLVIVSYFIGFLTACIAFGVFTSYNKSRVKQEHIDSVNVKKEFVDSEFADAGGVAPNEVVPESQSVSDSGSYTEYQNGELTFHPGNETSILLSAHAERLGLDASVMRSVSQGVHVSIPTHLVSIDGKFVYFCEVTTNESVCKSFVYGIDSQKIYFVESNEVHLEASTQDAKNASWEEGSLRIGDFASVSSDTPWLLK